MTLCPRTPPRSRHASSRSARHSLTPRCSGLATLASELVSFGAFSNAMNTRTEKDFDELGWHDNYIHSLAIREGEYGSGELILDIDHILEWNCPPGEICEFVIAPATLTVLSVTDLQRNVDYAVSSAATGPMSIDGIEREVKVCTPMVIQHTRGKYRLAGPLDKLHSLHQALYRPFEVLLSKQLNNV